MLTVSGMGYHQNPTPESVDDTTWQTDVWVADWKDAVSSWVQSSENRLTPITVLDWIQV